MRKEKVFKFRGKWYRWRYEDMSAKLITAVAVGLGLLAVFWVYMFVVVCYTFWGCW